MLGKAIKQNKSFRNIFILVVILLGLSLTILPYWLAKLDWSWEADNKTALIGDTVGGIYGPIIALFGILLTFLAFYIQYEANIVQKNALFTDQFESKFFELIRMHRENVKNIDKKDKKGLNALKAFSTDLYNLKGKVKVDESLFSEEQIIQIVFSYFLNGANPSTQSVLSTRINPDKNQGKERELSKTRRICGRYLLDQDFGTEEIDADFEIYLSHIFQIFWYLDEQLRDERLESKDKTFYIKTLNRQLTNAEKSIFFFYSISNMDTTLKYIYQLIHNDGFFNSIKSEYFTKSPRDIIANKFNINE